MLDGFDVIAELRRLLPGLQADARIEGALARLQSDATAAHPEIRVEGHVWAGALARALEGDAAPSFAERLATLPAADLWLAAAAATGNAAAIDTFERTLVPEVDRALRRLSLLDDELDELRQCVRVRLLVAGPRSEPRIAQYRGRGSLAGWVRTVATRTALNARRGAAARADPHDFAARLSLSTPEFAQLRRESQAVFTRAFQDAFGDLTPRARNLLRLRHVDDLHLDALARAYQVHVSTASRWLTAARDALATAFASRVAAELGDEQAVAELLGLVRSRFDGSLRSMLTSARAGGESADA